MAVLLSRPSRAGPLRRLLRPSLVLIAKPPFQDGRFLRRDLRRGFVDHRQKPIDLLAGVRMADILGLPVSGHSQRIDNGLTLRIEERVKRQPCGPTEALQEFFTARCVQVLLLFCFLHIDMDHDEIFVDHRLHFRGPDETIEFMTPPSPGGVEDHPDGAVVGGSLSLGFVQERIG
jgi:hypothetical protein